MESRRRREMSSEDLRGAAFRYVIFADDVITIISDPSLDGLEVLAHREAQGKPRDLDELRLSTEQSKSKNFIAPPGIMADGIHRRVPNAHRRGITQTRKRGNELEGMSRTTEKDSAAQSDYDQMQRGLPYQSVDCMRILGILVDRRFCFGGHIGGVIERSKVRLAVLGSLAGRKRGEDLGALRLTGEALVVSLMRYCCSVVGSGAYEPSIRALDTSVIHVVARKVVGVSRPARLPVPLAAAGFLSAHNLHAQQCAVALDHSLRAEASSAQDRLLRRLSDLYGERNWETEIVALSSPRDLLPHRIYQVPFYDLDIQEKWMFTVL